MLDALKRELRAHASPAKARLLSRYFKTGPGEYGEGDVFIGVMVPQTRAVAKKFAGLPFSDIGELLASDIHEERLCALLILVHRFDHGDAATRRAVYRFYLSNADHVDNWDLVDLSAPNIVGEYLLRTKDSGTVLVRLAKSRNVWRRRIAVLATFAFIRAGRHVPTYNIARMLLDDDHDLVHKAVGWGLREVGKRIGQDVEEEFLKRHYRTMPRTMLRYAVERFPKRLALAYLNGRIE
jgi:3-methyladenine DNA glycosylase AlkD